MENEEFNENEEADFEAEFESYEINWLGTREDLEKFL